MTNELQDEWKLAAALLRANGFETQARFLTNHRAMIDPEKLFADEVRAGCSVRVRKALRLLDVATFEDLAKLTEREFLNARNTGPSSLGVLKSFMAKHGMELLP